MKKSILVILLFTLLISCQESKLELKLINKEIVSKGFSTDTIEAFYNHGVFNSENEKYLFTNTVKLELSNHTNKKYLLFIKDLHLSNLYHVDIIIEDEKGNLLEKNAPLIDPSYSCKMGSLLEQDFYIQNEKELLLKKMGYNIKSEFLNFYNQEIIISPKENYILKTSLPLPFVVEDKVENLRSPIYFKLNPQKKYTFRLKYKLKYDMEKIIPKDILSNYKENNIEIFKGEIETQRIPIVFK
ncbi:hypothetical protein [Flavobacterium sp. Root186]|uniref:hypothetical protein n=1 Tax=Flavobacterium sp. Root186 TaxID=1736485 RepID=UPI000ACF7867|nr:hypothetical protein [Flavobacterium sp. Root186]